MQKWDGYLSPSKLDTHLPCHIKTFMPVAHKMAFTRSISPALCYPIDQLKWMRLFVLGHSIFFRLNLQRVVGLLFL